MANEILADARVNMTQMRCASSFFLFFMPGSPTLTSPSVLKSGQSAQGKSGLGGGAGGAEAVDAAELFVGLGWTAC